jgi:hypothetical protein
MGLLTDSAYIRDLTLNRNLYSAEHDYNLDNDLISKTLNSFNSIGLDLRSSKLLAGAERLEDNTKLGQVGLQRLAVEFGRRVAQNIFREEIGAVTFDNLFSTDPNAKLITKPTDFTITPTTGATNLVSYLEKAAGYESLELPTPAGKETNVEEAPGGRAYYDNLGAAQKAKLHEQLAQNNFNRYPNGTDPYAKLRAQPGRYSTSQDVYSKEFLDKRQAANSYGSYIQEDNVNSTLDTQTTVIETIGDATGAGVRNMQQLATEGFGATSLPLDPVTLTRTDADYFQYDTDGSNLEKFGAERGLVYYTQQMALGQGQVADALQPENTEYGQGENNIIVYRGTGPCRNFTFLNPLARYEQGIRFKGNGNVQSVVGRSVIPNFFPRVPPSKAGEGVREPIMFSMENLAYSREDLLDVPLSEQGPNQGRFMWFPPYGVTITESYSANIGNTDLLGRTEPIYTYNGVTRQASISFMLLIDAPPHVQDLDKQSLADWFWGCANMAPPIPALEPRPIKAIVPPQPPTPVKPPDNLPAVYKGSQIVYYFENDENVINNLYENGDVSFDGRKQFNLNGKNFWPNIEGMLAYVDKAKKANRKVTLEIEGRCSALATNIYNMKLSYRRATNFFEYLIKRHNAEFPEAKLVFPDAIPLDQISDKVTKVGPPFPTFTYTSADKTVTVILTGKGEETTGGRGSKIREIDTQETKKLRYAIMKKVSSKPQVPVYPSITPPAGPVEAKQRRDEAEARDTQKNVAGSDRMEPMFRQDINEGDPFPMGWDNVDYFASVFHSQTPYDLHKRVQFLRQLMYPGDTKEKAAHIGSNSLFGRMPVTVIRYADWFHSKVFVNNLNFDLTESTWDTNPEGMGMQPIFLKVTMDVTVIGGMSMKGPINKIQTATDFNHVANSTFYSEPYYSQDRWDYKKADSGDPYRVADSRNDPEKTTI